MHPIKYEQSPVDGAGVSFSCAAGAGGDRVTAVCPAGGKRKQRLIGVPSASIGRQPGASRCIGKLRSDVGWG